MFAITKARYSVSLVYLFVAIACFFIGYQVNGSVMHYLGLVWFLLAMLHLERTTVHSIIREKDAEIDRLRRNSKLP
jgi:hypothetical protein